MNFAWPCRGTLALILPGVFLLFCGCNTSSPSLYRRTERDPLVEEEGPNMAVHDTGGAGHVAPSRAGLPAAPVEDDRRAGAPADREGFVVVPETQARQGRLYQVQKGDTLSKIARQFYGDDWEAAAQRIYQANRDLIRSPDVLAPGTQLRLP